MNGKKVAVLSLAGVMAVSLASCKAKMGFNYADYEFSNPNASVTNVSNDGRYYNYVASTYEEREQILGKLEDYAITNNITGMTLFENTSLIKYSDAIKAPITGTVNGKENKFVYVDGYGFGIIEEGTSTTNKYRMAEPSDPKTLNYMNDKGSVVGSYHPYVTSSYFSTRLTRDESGKFTGGYEWFPSLATNANEVGGKVRPVPVVGGQPNKDASQLSKLNSKYRIYVRTDIKYAIKTDKATKKYDGRQVELEDYVTIWQEYLTQANGLARSAENLNSSAAIKGALNYYNNSKAGFNQDAWDEVGIKTGTDSNGSYLEFEFVTPCTPFYAMYYLSSGLYSPLPKEFIEEIGGMKYFGSFSADGKMTPVDTTLSTGPYVVNTWNSGQNFSFTKNEKISPEVRGDYNGGQRYQIKDLEVSINTNMSQNAEAAWNEFEANKLDVVAVPTTKVDAQKNNPLVQQGKGSSTFKLNVNSSTEEEWETSFGTNGIVTQTQESEYWQVEPAMSNDDFLKALSYSIDRKSYAEKRGKTPSIEYFSDNYMINPEDGLSYNATETHKEVMEKHYGADFDENYGFNATEAQRLFKEAADQLIADGKYKKGDTINIELAWMYEKDEEEYGADLVSMITKQFNAANTGLNLKFEHWASTEWSDVYYKKMLVGQFDIALGGISGNSLNPINFMEVLKSNNSTGFTLNYGGSTDDPNNTINYDNREFTFDALFQAADTGAVISDNGTLANPYGSALQLNTHNEEDGSRTVKFDFKASNTEGVITHTVDTLVFEYVDANTDQSKTIVLEKGKDYTVEGSVYTVTLPKEVVEAAQGTVSIAINMTQHLKNGNKDEFIDLKVTHRVNAIFPVWEELH